MTPYKNMADSELGFFCDTRDHLENIVEYKPVYKYYHIL